MDPSFEPVHTVLDYYDGPLNGVADFQGAPHFYRALFSETDDEWDDRFELSPLAQDTFALALEDWAIWKRFERQYRGGEVAWSGAKDEWGALPEDWPRHREIASVLDTALAIDPHRRIVAVAEFRARQPAPPDSAPGAMRPLEVRWTPVE